MPPDRRLHPAIVAVFTLQALDEITIADGRHGARRIADHRRGTAPRMRGALRDRGERFACGLAALDAAHAADVLRDFRVAQIVDAAGAGDRHLQRLRRVDENLAGAAYRHALAAFNTNRLIPVSRGSVIVG